MRRNDRAALKLALETARQDSKLRDQIDSMLKGEPWETVAKFCASHCQSRALHLKPWQWPPIYVTDIAASLSQPPDDPHQVRNAALLLQRMQRAGVSRYDPDPIRSLEAAEAARTRATAVGQRTLSPLYPRKRT